MSGIGSPSSDRIRMVKAEGPLREHRGLQAKPPTEKKTPTKKKQGRSRASKWAAIARCLTLFLFERTGASEPVDFLQRQTREEPHATSSLEKNIHHHKITGVHTKIKKAFLRPPPSSSSPHFSRDAHREFLAFPPSALIAQFSPPPLPPSTNSTNFRLNRH